MRSRMIIMVALLAIAGVMAAMAYTSATVTNSASVKVSNTDEALLALGCNRGVGHKDGTCSTESGRLALDFTKGRLNNHYGMQPGSTYEFEDLFWVKNNSRDTISVKITGPTITPATHASYEFSEDAFDLAPGESMNITVTGIIGNDATVGFTGTVDFTVEAEAK